MDHVRSLKIPCRCESDVASAVHSYTMAAVRYLQQERKQLLSKLEFKDKKS